MRRPLLLPLVPLYAAGVSLRSRGIGTIFERVQRLNRTVISIGNLSAGGTGKTPFTIALAKLLVAEGFAVDILSRGYGRSGTSAERVDAAGDAGRFGDEPLVIAREAGVPVYVGARRWEAGCLAEGERAPAIHLLDDGFQHRQLYRDVDIVLVNSEDLGDWLLPAGNLREPLTALRRADVFAVLEGDEAAARKLEPLGKAIWWIRREMTVPEISGPAVAFCGIARPRQFFAGIKGAGVGLAGTHAFRDHHRYELSDIQLLRRLVEGVGGKALLTTAKDRVRLGSLEGEVEMIAPLHTVGLRTSFVDEGAVVNWLRQRLLPS